MNDRRAAVGNIVVSFGGDLKDVWKVARSRFHTEATLHWYRHLPLLATSSWSDQESICLSQHCFLLSLLGQTME